MAENEKTFEEKLFDKLLEKFGGFKDPVKALNEVIGNKMEELEGFITREGAIRLIANELQVRLSEGTILQTLAVLKLGNITTALTGEWVNVRVLVLDVYPPVDITLKDGSQAVKRVALVEDGTGTATVTFWDEAIEELNSFRGRVITIKGVKVGFWEGKLQLGMGKYSQVQVYDTKQAKLGE